MNDTRGLDELMAAAGDKPAGGELARLYDQAFREFGALALWSSRKAAAPRAADVLAITRSLRVEGNRAARRLAERIEELCRAAL